MESRIMEFTVYRLLYDDIHDFKTATMYIESEIKLYGIGSESDNLVSGMKGRTHHDKWISMKTVAHFNLGTTLELMLKLLLTFNNMSIPHRSSLTRLHDAIPVNYQKQLESTYQVRRTIDLPQ